MTQCQIKLFYSRPDNNEIENQSQIENDNSISHCSIRSDCCDPIIESEDEVDFNSSKHPRTTSLVNPSPIIDCHGIMVASTTFNSASINTLRPALQAYSNSKLSCLEATLLQACFHQLQLPGYICSNCNGPYMYMYPLTLDPPLGNFLDPPLCMTSGMNVTRCSKFINMHVTELPH